MVSRLNARADRTSLEQARTERAATVDRLMACIYGLETVEVLSPGAGVAVYRMTLRPWPPMASEAYPTEVARVLIWPNDRIVAVPERATCRLWKHQVPLEMSVFGELCLWDPDDPRGLRWEPEDGFETYITIVHRHLQAEEFWRREGAWPVEDAPHGEHAPIATEEMRRAASRWAA